MSTAEEGRAPSHGIRDWCAIFIVASQQDIASTQIDETTQTAVNLQDSPSHFQDEWCPPFDISQDTI